MEDSQLKKLIFNADFNLVGSSIPTPSSTIKLPPPFKSAFIFFYEEIKPKLADELYLKEKTEFESKLISMYANLTVKSKTAYEAYEASDKKRYEKQITEL